jgi:hypothetical protein
MQSGVGSDAADEIGRVGMGGEGVNAGVPDVVGGKDGAGTDVCRSGTGEDDEEGKDGDNKDAPEDCDQGGRRA